MTATLSTLKCPFDNTVLETYLAGDGAHHWFCPVCHDRWTDEAAIGRVAKKTPGSRPSLITEAPSSRPQGEGRILGAQAAFHPYRVTGAASGEPVAPEIKPAKTIGGRPQYPTSVTPRGLKPAALRGYETAPGAQITTRTRIELFYDSIAEEFDRIMNRYDLQRRMATVFDVLLGRYDLCGRRLLDAGCGTGWFSLRACQRGAIVTALDIGPRLLDQVRRKCNAKTVCGDVLDLQFDDGSFDVVVSSECIEHTRDPRRAVQELIRICRPGGLVVITCPNHTWYWLCALANKFHLRPYEGIENWPTWSQLHDWIQEAHAAVIQMRGIHLLPFQLTPLRPVLKFLDRFGRILGRFCVNQAALAVKLC